MYEFLKTFGSNHIKIYWVSLWTVNNVDYDSIYLLF